jgi:hypothetical protein
LSIADSKNIFEFLSDFCDEMHYDWEPAPKPPGFVEALLWCSMCVVATVGYLG